MATTTTTTTAVTTVTTVTTSITTITNTTVPTVRVRKVKGSFEMGMSKAQATALTSDPKAKEAFSKALATTIGVDTKLVTITAIYIDGKKVSRRLGTSSVPRRLADPVITVEYEVETEKLVVVPVAALKTNVVKEAKAIGQVVVVTRMTAATPVPSCRTTAGRSCIFPFKFKGMVFGDCTTAESKINWCAIKVDKDGVSKEWGECSATCGPAIFPVPYVGQPEVSGSHFMTGQFLASAVLLCHLGWLSIVL